jgi:hypothetical protein
MSMNLPPDMPSHSPRDPDGGGSGTSLALAAIAVVVVLAGLLLFTGGKKEMPSTAEQPKTESPSSPAPQSPEGPKPPSTDGKQ